MTPYSVLEDGAGAGLEPARFEGGDFKSPVSTYFTTRALPNLEAEVGIEPASTELQSAA